MLNLLNFSRIFVCRRANESAIRERCISASVAAMGVAIFAAFAPAAHAQDNVAAGLSTTAGQLPMVAQSVSVEVIGQMATITLEQEFVNPHEDVRQADYRFHLAPSSRVTGFGFYSEGKLLNAKLKDRDTAEKDHRAAAAAGRETGLAKSQHTTQSFSVFPIKKDERKRIQIRIEIPAAFVGGRAAVRLPLSAFVAQTATGSTRARASALGAGKMATTNATAAAPVRTPIVAHVVTDAQLKEVQLVGTTTSTRIQSGLRSATLVGDAAGPVELRWRTQSPPLAAHAFEVALPNGKRGVEVAVTFTDFLASRVSNKRLKMATFPQELTLIVDGSASMRAHAGALRQLLQRVLSTRESVDVVAVGSAGVIAIAPSTSAGKMARQIVDGRAGHQTKMVHIRRAIKAKKCARRSVRCVVIIDGQFQSAKTLLKSETRSLVLANADDVDRAPTLFGAASKAALFIDGVHPLAKLDALVDEVARPNLNVALASYGKRILQFSGRPTMRVAEGSQKRFFAELPRAGRSTNKSASKTVVLDVTVEGRSLALRAPVAKLKASSARGKALRKSVYRNRLDDMVRAFEKKPSTKARDAIVKLSLREAIPTTLTAWHVARKAPTVSAGAPSAAHAYKKRTVIDFSDVDIRGELVKPGGPYMHSRVGGGSTLKSGESYGTGGLGVSGIGTGGGGGGFARGVGHGSVGTGTGRGSVGRGMAAASVDDALKRPSSRRYRKRIKTINISDTDSGSIDLGGRGKSAGSVSSGSTGYGIGRGDIDLGGRGKSRVSVRGAAVTYRGSLDRSQISRTVRRNTSRVRFCYEKALVRSPGLSGKVVVRFKIGAAGRVTFVKIESSEIEDEAFAKCLTKSIKRFRFPKPRGGSVVFVTYPFIFTAHKSAAADDDRPEKRTTKMPNSGD